MPKKLIAADNELGKVLAENLQGALPAIALDGHPALSTAYMNDCEPLLCFCTAGQRIRQTGRCLLRNIDKRKQQKRALCRDRSKGKGHEGQ